MAKSISELTTQATANETDLFEVAIVDTNSASGYASKKESAAVIAEGIVNQYTYPLGMPNMQAKTILGAINQLLANVAAVYDDTATYSEGDFRTHNGQLYKCNTDISTAETFDPTKWDAVNLADNLGSGGGGGGGISYSTEERVVGTWIDGKPLYQYTFNITPNSSGVTYINYTNYGLTNIKEIVYVNAFNHGGQYNIGTIANGYVNTDGGYGVCVQDITTTGLSYKVGSQLLNGKFYITIRYTKTTD